MEDYGDLIFYLIAAVIGIIGAITNKKKRKAERGLPQEEDFGPRQEEEFDYSEAGEEPILTDTERAKATTQYEMIDEDSLVTKGRSIEDTPQFKTSEEEALERVIAYKDSYSQKARPEYESQGWDIEDDTPISEIKYDADAVLAKEDESSWAADLADEFDLPRAIVYSEILRRKDFV